MMITLRRWWDRHGIRTAITVAALGGAWALRQTQGAAISEVYQGLTRPFQIGLTTAERISDARITELQTRIAELENQNKKLQEMVGYTAEQKSTKEVVAPIIGRSADHWWQQVTIGRGSSAGIKVGDTVTAPGGLIGRIVSVSPNTSRVLLITDATSQLGVTVSRSRNMGFLRGQSDRQAVMQFFEKVPDVRAGDFIATSQYSQMFPAGIPVGKVQSVNLNKTPAPEAIIELSAPIRYLEWVVVTPKAEKPAQSEQPAQPAQTEKPN
ncbi:MAG: rod shape-determining protein MreC [Nostocaceae cyanobacterium]|nr:rod shape-determining protein MreC [Nostocaceae cyanobacterium]